MNKLALPTACTTETVELNVFFVILSVNQTLVGGTSVNSVGQ